MKFRGKLTDGVEVEWKPLWEVTTWGKNFNAVDNFKQPKVIKYKNLLSKEIKSRISESGRVKLLTTNLTHLYTTEERAGKDLSQGEIIAIPAGCGNPVVQYYKGKFLTSGNLIATSNDTNLLNTKYLYYFLLNNLQLISSFYHGTGIKHPSMIDVLDIEIPIPPLNVQSEIVRALDLLTTHTEELTDEITARGKQYKYYRDQLLTFEYVDVEPLGEVATIDARISNGQDEKANGGYPFYVRSKSILKSKVLQFDETSIVVPHEEGGGGDASHQGAYRIHLISDKLNSKFLFHLMTDKIKTYILTENEGSPSVSIRKSILEKFPIPIPPLNIQTEIVRVLDTFSRHTDGITSELTDELTARKKQYHYYLDNLLSFPKSVTT